MTAAALVIPGLASDVKVTKANLVADLQLVRTWQTVSYVNVRDYGAVGDGSTDDTAAIQAAIDACFGSSASPHGTAANYQNRILAFPPGVYRVTSPLLLTKLHGGRIEGCGRFVTQISNTAGTAVFQTNGCGYAHFHGMYLKATGSAKVFDLDWDGTSGGAALQSNTFFDMFFDGGHFGVYIAASNYMGSENEFMNCFWISNSTAGIIAAGTNALSNSIRGGNFQTCGDAIFASAGGFSFINTQFQQSTGYDIRLEFAAYNTTEIVGCRSESTNFVKVATSVPTKMSACSHTGLSNGDTLYTVYGPVSMDCCTSVMGRVQARTQARVSIRNSEFNRSDWLNAPDLSSVGAGDHYDGLVEIENVLANIDSGTGVAASQIKRQRITAAGTFNYVLEAA